MYLINSNLKFNTVKSDQLYYGLYQYSARFVLQECWIFRYTTDHDEIDRRLTRQQEWRERLRQRWPADQLNRYTATITDAQREAVHAMADFILAIQAPYKIVVENRNMRIYTNDVQVLNMIDQLKYVDRKCYSQTIVDRPRNTVRLKNPRHKYRSYFRETKITPEDRAAITQFLTAQQGIRIGQGLQDWLDEKRLTYASKYTRDYFFVDYDHPGWSTMLNLVRPGLIRKTVDIIAK